MDAASLVEAARAGFAAAHARAGGEVVQGTLAGRVVRVETAGSFFGPELRRGLAFLRSAAAPMSVSPSLRVRAWDAATTGQALGGPAWEGVEVGPAGVVITPDDRYHVSFDVYGALLSVLDKVTGEAFHYLPDPDRLPYWERTHPARLLLAAWARCQGLLICHAAAVANRGAGILLAGAGGAGKSTTALACLGEGLDSAGDDYVLVDVGAEPSVHALYTSTLLEASHASRHAGLMPVVDRLETDEAKGRDKVVMYATGADRPHVGKGFPLAALAALRVQPGAAPSFRPASPALVLRALAPTTMAQLGMLDADALGSLAQLCRRLPCYELTLGREPERVPALVREMIATARAAA